VAKANKIGEAGPKGRAKRPPKIKRPKTPKELRPSFAGRIRNYFLAGVLVTAPVSITFWIAWKIVSLVDNRVTPLIPPRWNPETYLPFSVPGLGLLVVFLVLTLVGFFTAGYVGRLVTRISDAATSRVPIVSSVYSWTKQVFETVLSHKSTAFRDVVLIEYPNRGTWAVGFITGKTVGEVQGLTAETVYNVFIPATPNPTTGFLLFIPERDVHKLDLTVEEGIKLVISGGIVAPPARSPEEKDVRRLTLASEEDPQTQGDSNGNDRVGTNGEEDMSRPHRLSLMLKMRNYFFAGVLVTAPLAITAWFSWELVSFIDNQVRPFIPPVWNPETYLPFSLPGVGLFMMFLLLVVIGFFAAGVFGRSLVGWGERLLDTVPVIRGVYATVKQIIETVFKQQSKAFREVVLLEYPRKESWAIGFITADSPDRIEERTPQSCVNIFLPTTPNPTSGFLLFLPRENTRTLSMTVEEGIKMVVSGGIVTPEDRRSAEAHPEEAEPEERLPERRSTGG